MPSPLEGRRILVTRTRAQASALAAGLAELGAVPIVIPSIEIVPPASFTSLDAALSSLGSFDLVVFTSPNAVTAAASRAHTLRLPLHPHRLAAIGSATASALQVAEIAPVVGPVLVPPSAVAESLVSYLVPLLSQIGGGARTLPAVSADPPPRIALIRAEAARDHLPEALAAAGAHVTLAIAYRTVVPPASAAMLRDHFTPPQPFADAVTFTSSSTAAHLLPLLASAGISLPPSALRVSIGPATSATLRHLGIPPHVEAAAATVPALLDALLAAFSKSR